MGKFSRSKGARGEREWRDFLRETWCCPDAIRGRQYRGGDDSPDVRNGVPGTHAEVKRTEALSLYKAMEQAVEDSPEEDIPYVAHKRNRQEWLVIVHAKDMESFARRLIRQIDNARSSEDSSPTGIDVDSMDAPVTKCWPTKKDTSDTEKETTK